MKYLVLSGSGSIDIDTDIEWLCEVVDTRVGALSLGWMGRWVEVLVLVVLDRFDLDRFGSVQWEEAWEMSGWEVERMFSEILGAESIRTDSYLWRYRMVYSKTAWVALDEYLGDPVLSAGTFWGFKAGGFFFVHVFGIRVARIFILFYVLVVLRYSGSVPGLFLVS